jgi:hypothetical protein
MKHFNYLLLFCLLASRASGQEDSVKSHRIKYYAQSLGINTAEARKVAIIMDDYQSQYKKIVTDSHLSADMKSRKLDIIKAQKNESLLKMPSKDKLTKLIPTAELVELDPAFAGELRLKQAMRFNKPGNSTATNTSYLRVKKLRALEMMTDQQIKEVGKDTSLTKEQQKNKIDGYRRVLREQSILIMQATNQSN